MNLSHELVEVDAEFLFKREQVVEDVCQPAFAPANATPDVEPFFRRGIHPVSTEKVGKDPVFSVCRRRALKQTVVECLKGCNGSSLGWICRYLIELELFPIVLRRCHSYTVNITPVGQAELGLKRLASGSVVVLGWEAIIEIGRAKHSSHGADESQQLAVANPVINSVGLFSGDNDIFVP